MMLSSGIALADNHEPRYFPEPDEEEAEQELPPERHTPHPDEVEEEDVDQQPIDDVEADSDDPVEMGITPGQLPDISHIDPLIADKLDYTERLCDPLDTGVPNCPEMGDPYGDVYDQISEFDPEVDIEPTPEGTHVPDEAPPIPLDDEEPRITPPDEETEEDEEGVEIDPGVGPTPADAGEDYLEDLEDE